MSATYEQALNADGALVHISDAERGGQYFCVGCDKRLVALLGDKSPRRFRHYAAADEAPCAPLYKIPRITNLAITTTIVAGWRAAKANGWEYPVVMPCESCQNDMRLLDATDFDHAGDGRELVEGTRPYAAFWGDALANDKLEAVEITRTDVAFWGGRASMAIKVGRILPSSPEMALYRNDGIEFFVVNIWNTIWRKDDGMLLRVKAGRNARLLADAQLFAEMIDETARRVKVEADGRVCEPCRKKADLTVRRLQEEERQAKERGEPIDYEGMAANGQSVFHSRVARALTEMGHSQNNAYFLRLASKFEKSAVTRVRNAAKKHRQAVGDSQGWTCPYCGRDVSGRVGVIDHKIPVSRGGTSEPDNLDILCQRCNSSKNNLTPEEYLAYRKARAIRSYGIRQAVGDSQDWLCPRCGRDVSGQKGVIHLEFPVSWESELDNLVILCRRCHFSQRDRTQ